jgi:hypothetical protein
MMNAISLRKSRFQNAQSNPKFGRRVGVSYTDVRKKEFRKAVPRKNFRNGDPALSVTKMPLVLPYFSYHAEH